MDGDKDTGASRLDKEREMRSFAIILTVAAVTNVAAAYITMEIVEVDNTPGGDDLAGYVTQDIVITTHSDWLTAALIVDVGDGDIYLDEIGGMQSPNPIFFQFFPSLEFDTYVSNGVLDKPVSTGSAAIIGGPPTQQFDEDHISIGWTTNNTDDVGTLALTRVTLRDTAAGTWSFYASAHPDVVLLDSGIVQGGHLIPEPGSLCLLALGAALALWRTRR